MTEVDRRIATGEASDAELAQLPELNPGPVCRLAPDGTVLFANTAARNLLGDAVVGSSWIDRWPGMDAAAWREVLDSPTPSSHEAQVGDTWLLFTHVKPEGGDSVFVFGTDITGRKHAEQHLAEIARFPDVNPGPVLRLEPDGTVLLANRAAQDVFGGDVVGENWLGLCPGIDDARWTAMLAATDPLPVEANVGGREFLFTHKREPASHLMYVFGSDITQQRHTEQALRQSERMATLGTLAAGVAHELNNPAAATSRAADQLHEAFGRLEAAHAAMAALPLEGVARALIDELAARAREAARRPPELDALDRSDRESEVEDWLEDYGVAEPWDLAPALVAQGFDVGSLEDLTDVFGEEAAPTVLEWLAAAHPIYVLSHEIANGASRISEIVGALKNYSYLGQASLKAVDLHEGIDNTLVILRNKLKGGVVVRREYADDLPRVPAYGGEINQVWTNLLDNAIDAMEGNGEITIRTRLDRRWVSVEVEDTGPGIPPEILPRIFDAFFTTKDPGRGTGLGLSTTYSIVVDRHGGSITADSRPGCTRFTVRLPLEA